MSTYDRPPEWRILLLILLALIVGGLAIGTAFRLIAPETTLIEVE
jgi:hypothetical protein